MPRTRIIAVDDDRRILRVLKRACETVGYEVHSVLDAEFFESAFSVFPPDLIFLDLNMRGIDGFELLRFMAREGCEASIIVVSGVDEQIMRSAHVLGLSLGLRMLEPIRKPLMVADIRRRLKEFHQRPKQPLDDLVSEEELNQALDDGRIEVCYQPMVDLTTRRVVCAEALARIRRLDGSLIPPAQFIPLAERIGRIEDVTFAVLGHALERVSGWRSPMPELQVAVNLSPVLLHDPDIARRIMQVVKAMELSPSTLVLEVAQTGAHDNTGHVAETLKRLRSAGFSLSLDDFGAGFCSLGQLYEFPYEILKLDRKFAMRARENPEAAAMIRSSLDLARSVGLTVVAEGIQNEDTLNWLGRLGCDVGQGYHISPPMSPQAFYSWLLDMDRLGPSALPRAAAV